MASVPQIGTQDTFRRIRRVQAITFAWMSVEAAVSLFATWRARSPALLAFGGDSTIELFSAAVVLWRFRTTAHDNAELRAARVAGALLFALAAYIVITSVASLLGYSEPKPTLLGIAILVAAAAVMPWLACEREAAVVRSDRWCCAEGGRRSVGAVRLPCAGRFGGTGDQRDLAR
jgi:divalent metal cation (Fe/Co/Zn/Cd) transporter